MGAFATLWGVVVVPLGAVVVLWVPVSPSPGRSTAGVTMPGRARAGVLGRPCVVRATAELGRLQALGPEHVALHRVWAVVRPLIRGWKGGMQSEGGGVRERLSSSSPRPSRAVKSPQYSGERSPEASHLGPPDVGEDCQRAPSGSG